MAKEVMSEEKQDTVVKGLIADANSLQSRLDTYLENAKQANPSLEDMHIIFNQSANSVIDGLGADIIRLFLEEEKIQVIVDNIHEHSAECMQFANSEKESAKQVLVAAKIEAKLKGFDLPLSMGGPANELDPYGIKQEDYITAMDATKEALIALANQEIPKREYADKVVEKTAEILKSKGVDDPKFVEFVSQGKKNPDKYKTLSESRRTAVKSAISESAEKFNQRFKRDVVDIKNLEARNIAQQALKDLDKNHNSSVSKETSAKILAKIAPALQKLDPKYLKENRASIAAEIAKEISRETSFLSKIIPRFLRKNVSISSVNIDKAVQKIANKHINAKNSKKSKPHPPKGPKPTEKDIPKVKRVEEIIAEKSRAFEERKNMSPPPPPRPPQSRPPEHALRPKQDEKDIAQQVPESSVKGPSPRPPQSLPPEHAFRSKQDKKNVAQRVLESRAGGKKSRPPKGSHVQRVEDSKPKDGIVR